MGVRSSVDVKTLLLDMDRLIDFNHVNQKTIPRIVLTQEQYRAFLKRNRDSQFYRDVLVVPQDVGS